MSPRRILFVSYALRGHINQCIALAGELAERGHTVLVATQRVARDWLGHPGITWVSWEPAWPESGADFAAHLRAVRARASEQRNWLRGQAVMVSDLAGSYRAIFDSVDRLLLDLAPDLLIVPQPLSPAVDVAHQTARPLIAQAFYLPTALRRQPGSRVPSPYPRAGWRQRIESLRAAPALTLAQRRLERARRACARDGVHLPPTGELLRRTTIVAMSDSSVEGDVAFTPNVRLVGPMLSKPLPAVAPSTLRWIEEHAPAGVVLAAFGTLVTLDRRQIESLAEGLAGCGAAVLWALPECFHDLVRGASPSFRAETFVSQAAVLASSAVRAFVSHAGANSVLESLYWGRPILALPFMLEQHYYARRAVDLGVGLTLDPWAVTSRAVRQAIGRLLHETAFADAAAMLGRRLRSTPGRAGAADVVEAELARRDAPPRSGLT